MNQANSIRILLIVGLFIAFVVVFSSSLFITINSGEMGVIFKKFGGGLDKENVYPQGFHVIAPWNTMYVYSVREQQMEESMDVLSSNGLSINVDISVRFHPMYKELGFLHDKFGANYSTQLVVPEVRSAVRTVIGRYMPEELYSTKREEVQVAIFDVLENELGKNHVTLKALLIRSVKLPLSIQEAIEKKLKQEQESLEYEFRLTRERKEAERKRIEAQGIQEFQDIVSKGISREYLKWKGIEATNELAKSPNTKVVVIGNPSDGLPIILGSDK